MNENVDLANAVEGATEIVNDVNATNDNLHIKINVMEINATKREKVISDSKIKDDKKRQVEEIGKLQEKVKALNKLVKCKDEVNYDLNKKLENARESVREAFGLKNVTKSGKSPPGGGVSKKHQKVQNSKFGLFDRRPYFHFFPKFKCTL